MTSSDLSSLTERLLVAAKTAGADAADAIAVSDTSLSVDVRAGTLEHAERAEGVDLGLRVFVGQRQANVSASDTSDRTIEEMALRAVAMAGEAPEDPNTGLADPSQLATDWDVEALELYDDTDEPSAEALQDDALAAETAALDVNGVTQVQQATAAYGAREIWLAASNGFAGGYHRTDRALSCIAIAGTGTGMERDYSGDSRIFQ
ncbi:MAG: PmbA/TldA family metallopeptidase, partial [Tateyamaria sp.]